MYPRNEGAQARELWSRLHVVAQSAGAGSRPRTDAGVAQGQIAQGPATGAGFQGVVLPADSVAVAPSGQALHAALHAALRPMPGPTGPVPPPVPPGPSPVPPAHDVWGRLHYWAHPGKSGDAIAYGEAKSDSFKDGQVIKGPDGTVVAFGQVGSYARASGVAAAWGETHGEMWNAQGAAWAKAELSAMAYARGAYVKTKNSVMVMGETVAEAVARAEAGARGSAGVGSRLFQVDANLQGATEVGAREHSGGIGYVGLDSLGLPAFELGATANGMAGSRAQGMAQAAVSLLGLLRIRVGAVAQGMAGAAAGILGHIKVRDGDFALRFGGTAAAGIGGAVATEVGVELGTLPKGLLMTTVAPVVQAPILLINSIGKLFGQKDKPGEYTPDITDFPKLAAQTFVGGIKMVGQGATEIAQDIGNGVVAAGEGLATGAKFVGNTVVGAVVGVGEGIGQGAKFIGKTIASIFKGW
ncbi:MAG: hypothetical protein FJZ01_12460 [Candidatus Sericytochromatia bacterium]|nr:hypothetical protein [Candidatus Tanganyikabacteria bacterium]